jgi:hypothetical protein
MELLSKGSSVQQQHLPEPPQLDINSATLYYS